MNIPPGATLELLITTHSKQLCSVSAVEKPSAAPVMDTHFKFSCSELVYLAKTYSGVAYNGECTIDLSDVNCRQIRNLQQSSSAYTVIVSPSTYKVALALQDSRQTTGQYSSSEFTGADEAEKLLESFNIQYDGMSKPGGVDADPIYDKTTGKDFTASRYIETQLANGLLTSDCGGESLRDYQLRGAYHMIDWERAGDSAATSLTVNAAFSSAPTNSIMLVFDHSMSNLTLNYQYDRLVDVQVENR
jgi:hypothetical protein